MASQLERHGLAICIYHIPCVPIKRLYYKPIIYIYIYRIYIGVCVCGISSHIYIPYYIFPYHTIYISPNIVYMVNQLYHINIYLVIYHVLYTYCHPPQKKHIPSSVSSLFDACRNATQGALPRCTSWASRIPTWRSPNP